ncbi:MULTISPECIES: tetratricopeptide repeat protein [unclassified Beijerinckia]|uniref:tetratricopeptide repeat protein n=1 Tax=unclassified Beijerinckia TaxID=2638183 RepID=UPI00089A6162|nr:MULTISPECIES: tetratricopeptide repeat protein [unclassified Beijerinckia]MDH7794194.1 tetratricopeptide (TPR) repeat protein [Beijerinckia sp. GAS462]SEB55451.1 hypothetical protein SAMN05443249_0459 [Beijerinckia sp. 28-YEA-48]
MFRDSHGLELTCASTTAAVAYDHTIDGYLLNRFNVSQRLKACLAEDPDFCMAHVLRSAFSMMSFNEANVEFARTSLAKAQALAPRTSPREQAHVAALAHWIAGEHARTLAAWGAIATQWPHDILAFRMHHLLGFWCGQPELLLAQAETTLAHYGRELPAYGTVLACRAFAHEECGSYLVAENCAREAIAIDPSDVWATHALAHVFEMQGRRTEGIAFLTAMEPHWEGGNNLLHHLWWHRALYHIEREEFETALKLYDGRFRDLNSVTTTAMPDLYIDIQNAASALWRLERHGVDVGDRWQEIAAKAQPRIGDGRSPFTLPHWVLALARAGHHGEAVHFIKGIEDFALRNLGDLSPLVRDIALPICKAILAQADKRPIEALDLMRPVLGMMHRLGGSHAQQDLLEQMFLSFTESAAAPADKALILERIRGRRALSPERSIGWRDADSSKGR